jgi:hypothetical protein
MGLVVQHRVVPAAGESPQLAPLPFQLRQRHFRSEHEARMSWVRQSQVLMVTADAAGSLVGTYWAMSMP